MTENDISILEFLNFNGGPVMDSVMWFVSRWPGFLVMGIIMLYLLYRTLPLKPFLVCLLFAALAVFLADQTANFFKSTIPFMRPTHMEGVKELVHTVNGYAGGLYGTVSGHAANSFALALYGSNIIRKRWATILFFSFATLTSYSRIYLGVHFPSQILFGFIAGMALGAICYGLFTLIKNRMYLDKRRAI